MSNPTNRAKELADDIRDTIATATHECSLIGALRNAQTFLATIASAVSEEVGEIQRAHAIAEASPRCRDLRTPEDTTYSAAFAVAHKNRGTLLAIVLRQEYEALESCGAHEVKDLALSRAQADIARLTERLRMMQHGETEALKMMGAEKRRADELAAQLETERAEFAEFRRRLLKALKPVGIESGLLDIELAAVRTQELAAARGDAAETKQELAAMRDLAETLAKGISAYRWKSESVAAAWENDYGHTVPR